MTFLRYLSALPIIVSIVALAQQLAAETVVDPRVQELIALCKKLAEIFTPKPKLVASAESLSEADGTEEFERPLSTIYLFPYFQTREAFKEILGYEPPPFDPKRPPQHWFDPTASGQRIVRYDVLAVDDAGRPIYEPVTNFAEIDRGISRRGSEAAVPNIPPQEWQVTTGKLTEEPVPLDLSQLSPDERIMQRTFTGPALPVIRNLRKLADFEDDEPGYTVRDREAAKAANAKIDVIHQILTAKK